MRRNGRMVLVTIAAVLAVGCSDELQLPPTSEDVTVMTRNVYVGVDVDRVITAQSPEQFVVRVAEMWQMLHATNFAERADVLADEIAQARPHLVGLQEITLFRTQSPGDAVFGGTVPAEEVYLDYLAVLMEALRARGESYAVVRIMEATDVEVPMPRGDGNFDDVRMTDYDVVLARADVEIANARAGRYAAMLPVSTPTGAPVEIRRGWISVDATIGRQAVQFVNTHLEPADYTDQVQALQFGELLYLLSDGTKPLILVGDLNSEADGSGTRTYQRLLEAGLQDVHALDLDPDGAALTCCHDLGLRNESVQFAKRIDHILVGNVLVAPDVDAWVVGDEPSDRTVSGLWPSDHAGVVARITLHDN
ncbi:MAG: endonuclease/exonuclease/phosphatase family protein [Gemmatimonadales bacterium]